MDDERARSGHQATHEDDPDEQRESETPKPRRRLGSMISVRLSVDEATEVREAANAEGVSVSTFLRQAVLAQARSRPGIDVPPMPAQRVNAYQSFGGVEAMITVLSDTPGASWSMTEPWVGQTR